MIVHFLTYLSFVAVKASMNVSNIYLGAVKHLKEIETSSWVRSPFQLGHFALGRIHEGGLDVNLIGSVFNVAMIGRWSLPENGPREV